MSLKGLKVVELAGLAPAPFAGLILVDNGASVIRIDRPQSTSVDLLCRGKRSIAIDLKNPRGVDLLKKLIVEADVLIEPFRPGVMEKLGLGPDVFLSGLNKKLVYARVVGFPRTGEHQHMAGHDINYLALSGVLSMLPGTSTPSFPLNILADFAGGGLTCALGILLALIGRAASGKGQVVDVDMVSGTRYLSSFPLLHSMLPSSSMFSTASDPYAMHNPGVLQGGAPFYSVYSCSDGRFFSVGCLEPQFFATFIHKFVEALSGWQTEDKWKPTPQTQLDRDEWPRLRQFLNKGFLTKTRDEWTSVFHGSDACAVPVLTPAEAAKLTPGGNGIPVVHPQIGRTSESLIKDASISTSVAPLVPGMHTEAILTDFGLTTEEQQAMVADGVVSIAKMKDGRVRVKL